MGAAGGGGASEPGDALRRPDARTAGSKVLEGSFRSTREHDLPCETLEAEDVRRRFPALAPGRETVALHEARAGFIHPAAAIDAQLEGAAHLGAELRFEEPVVSWQAADSGDGVRVETPVAAYEAERLVFVPGAWAPASLPPWTFPWSPSGG